MQENDKFGYFGAFSGGNAQEEYLDLSNEAIKDATLMIGAGEEDMAYNYTDIGTPVFMEKLDEAGIEYIPYFVTGGHDWQCWPRMLTHFVSEGLWK